MMVESGVKRHLPPPLPLSTAGAYLHVHASFVVSRFPTGLVFMAVSPYSIEKIPRVLAGVPNSTATKASSRHRPDNHFDRLTKYFRQCADDVRRNFTLAIQITL